LALSPEAKIPGNRYEKFRCRTRASDDGENAGEPSIWGDPMKSFRQLPRAIVVCIVAALIAAAACDRPTSSGADAYVVRDSAGIALVENGHVGRADVPWWSVDTIPSLEIGAASGDPAVEFASIGSVAQLPNGMIVVLDGRGESAFEFRFFDSTGKHLATHGRRGEGPGEYRWVNFFGSAGGDTVIAVDFPSRRLNWLSASRGYLRSIRVDEERLKQLIGADASGTTETLIPLGDSLYAIAAFRRRPNATSPFDQARTYQIANLSTGQTVNLARFDEPSGKPITLSVGPASVFPVEPNMPVHVVDLARRRICAAVTGTSEIRCADDRDRRTIIRWRADSIPFNAEHRKAYEDRVRTNLASSRRYTDADIRAHFAAVEWPDRFNPFSVLRLDADGNFWILEPGVDSAGGMQRRFRILDPNGRHIAFADSFPVRGVGLGSRTYIGSTAVVRAFEDADGVPKVGVFPIRKSPR
jgi:hypothetical protein